MKHILKILTICLTFVTVGALAQTYNFSQHQVDDISLHLSLGYFTGKICPIAKGILGSTESDCTSKCGSAATSGADSIDNLVISACNNALSSRPLLSAAASIAGGCSGVVGKIIAAGTVAGCDKACSLCY